MSAIRSTTEPGSGNDMAQAAIDTIRTLSMDAVLKAHSGHVGAPLGLAPVAYTVWTEFLRTDPSLAWPVADGCATTRAEFAYAISHEGALRPKDLVERRTRVSFVDAHVPEATATAQELLEAAGVTG